ncbi:MAG: hypothetical protein ACLQKK_09405, partial [Rhodomicrobium sp.]
LISDLSLNPTGKIPVIGVHGTTDTNTYQFNVGFMISQQQAPTGLMLGNVTLFPVFGTSFNNEGCNFDVLLGRDVICAGQFSLGFNGQLIFCF